MHLAPVQARGRSDWGNARAGQKQECAREGSCKIAPAGSGRHLPPAALGLSSEFWWHRSKRCQGGGGTAQQCGQQWHRQGIAPPDPLQSKNEGRGHPRLRPADLFFPVWKRNSSSRCYQAQAVPPVRLLASWSRSIACSCGWSAGEERNHLTNRVRNTYMNGLANLMRKTSDKLQWQGPKRVKAANIVKAGGTQGRKSWKWDLCVPAPNEASSSVSRLMHKKNWKFKCSHRPLTQSECPRFGGTAGMLGTLPWMGGRGNAGRESIQGGCVLRESSSLVAQNIRIQPDTCLLGVSGLRSEINYRWVHGGAGIQTSERRDEPGRDFSEDQKCPDPATVLPGDVSALSTKIMCRIPSSVHSHRSVAPLQTLKYNQ